MNTLAILPTTDYSTPKLICLQKADWLERSSLRQSERKSEFNTFFLMWRTMPSNRDSLSRVVALVYGFISFTISSSGLRGYATPFLCVAILILKGNNAMQITHYTQITPQIKSNDKSRNTYHDIHSLLEELQYLALKHEARWQLCLTKTGRYKVTIYLPNKKQIYCTDRHSEGDALTRMCDRLWKSLKNGKGV